MNNTQYIVLDLEATCYDRNCTAVPQGFKNEIIEIGALKLDHEGNIIDTFEKFLKPKNFTILSEFCKRLTTITQHDIDTAEDARDVLQEFFVWSICMHNEKIENVVYVSWGHYDRKQFQYDLTLHQLNTNVINEANHISIKHKHGEWNNIKPMGLGRACIFEKIEFEGTAHRGIDDAKNIVKIFQKYLHKLS